MSTETLAQPERKTTAGGHEYLLLMEDYDKAYTRAFDGNSRLNGMSFDVASRELYSRAIFYGDSYIHTLNAMGHPADQVIPDCRPLQYKWAREHRHWTPPGWLSRRPFRWYWTQRYGEPPHYLALQRILEAQIQLWQPRVIWAFSGIRLTAAQIRHWRATASQLVLWWASPLRDEFPYDEFDLILSGIPSLVEHFRSGGIRAEYMAHAFDRRILERVAPVAERLPRLVFVGSLSRDHGERIEFLDRLSRLVEVDFYGRGVERLPADSPLRANYRGPVWGTELYALYAKYLLVFHRNIGMAGVAASAKRLFEATGMGACLVAEASQDMSRFFEPEREIATYRDFDDCVEKVRHLLAHPQEALQIGRLAQSRTLREHNYQRRVEQVLALTR